MQHRLVGSVATVALAYMTVAVLGSIPAESRAAGTRPAQMGISAPRGFIENRGQLDGSVRYYARGAGVSVYFTPGGVIVDRKEPTREQRLHGCAVRLAFEGANPMPVIEARAAVPTRYNFFLGNDASAWRTDVPVYSEVVYKDLWPGIDLVYRGEPEGIQYKLVARGGADASRARFRYEGADRVAPGTDGILRIETSAGAIEDSRPAGSSGEGHLAFPAAGIAKDALHPADAEHAMDNPASLLWSTFLGGNGHDAEVGDIGVSASDEPIVTGTTDSADFPVTTGAYDTTLGSPDVFVAKFNPSGSALVWCTFLGGSGDEYNDGQVIALDGASNPVLLGRTYSGDFPTTAGAYNQTNAWEDYFLTKLSASGNALIWSTFLWSNGSGVGFGLALDTAGDVYVTGSATGDFPATAGAYDTSLNGNVAAFVAKMNSTGTTLLWGSYLEGSNFTRGNAVTVDSSGNPVVVGLTDSPDFPTTSGAFDGTMGGTDDGFVTKFSAAGDALLWSTFLGGSGSDEPKDVKLDSSENAVVVGHTSSTDFPTTNGAYDTSYNGASQDMFVTSVAANGSTLAWSTYLGGSSNEAAYDVVLDPLDNPILTGWTASADFPTAGAAYDTSHNGSGDVIVSQLNASGASLLWSSFLGASTIDAGFGIALDSIADPVIVGGTNSPGFPTTPGAYDQSINGGMSDIFVAKFDLPYEPTPVLLQSFATEPVDGGILLRWTLSADVTATGFDLYRRSEDAPGWERINAEPILGGPEYEYLDATVAPGALYEYAVGWIDGRGERVRLGSVRIGDEAARSLSLRIAPNPARGAASITFSNPKSGLVRIAAFDVSGREVGVVSEGTYPSGTHTVTWSGLDHQGRSLPGGVYYITIEAPSGVRSRPMMRIR
jgi:hypothetical protein